MGTLLKQWGGHVVGAIGVLAAIAAIVTFLVTYVTPRFNSPSGGGDTTPIATSIATSIPTVLGNFTETSAGEAHTWTNYVNAGGVEGPSVTQSQGIQVSCRIQGFAVADGNKWWYRIASSPWNDKYYVSADAFYNNGAVSGPLDNTPFYDARVPIC